MFACSLRKPPFPSELFPFTAGINTAVYPKNVLEELFKEHFVNCFTLRFRSNLSACCIFVY